jgi:hypothetical protein
MPIAKAHEVHPAIEQVADGGGVRHSRPVTAGDLHAVLALLDPLVPGVLGDALGNQEGLIGAGAHLQHRILSQRPGAFRAQDSDGTLEHLDLKRPLLEIHAKPGFAAGGQGSAARLDLVKIVALEDDVKRGVTLVEGQAVDFAPAGHQGELGELQQRELAEARCGGVLKLDLGKPALGGG